MLVHGHLGGGGGFATTFRRMGEGQISSHRLSRGMIYLVDRMIVLFIYHADVMITFVRPTASYYVQVPSSLCKVVYLL